jgi:hypothetical protein
VTCSCVHRTAGAVKSSHCGPRGRYERMRDGMLAAWRNQVQGARALAMARTRAALYGGDADARQRLAVAFLTAIDSSSSGRTA